MPVNIFGTIRHHRETTIQPRCFFLLPVSRLVLGAVPAYKSGAGTFWKAPGITTVVAANFLTLILPSHQQSRISISNKGEARGSLLLLAAFLLDISRLCFTCEKYIFKCPGKKANIWQSESDPYTCPFLWGFGIRFCLFDFMQGQTQLRLAKVTIPTFTLLPGQERSGILAHFSCWMNLS